MRCTSLGRLAIVAVLLGCDADRPVAPAPEPDPAEAAALPTEPDAPLITSIQGRSHTVRVYGRFRPGRGD